MIDLSKLHPNALSAAMRGGTDGWGEVASATTDIRYMEPIKSRRRCHCCKGRITHIGMAKGIGLIWGCELRVARWAKETS